MIMNNMNDNINKNVIGILCSILYHLFVGIVFGIVDRNSKEIYRDARRNGLAYLITGGQTSAKRLWNKIPIPVADS